MSQRIVIVNYGMGNLHSIQKKMRRLNTDSVISSDPDVIANASKIILPGVGHFGMAMERLVNLKLIDPLNQAVLEQKVPILGICLGMQLFATKSEEGNMNGLGWIEGNVVKFRVSDPFKYKVPHMGWNQVRTTKSSVLMAHIPDEAEFYFVHSFHYAGAKQQDILNETIYDYSFVSGVEKGNIFGVQYHPEKSHDWGNQLLKNFIHI